MGFEPTVHSRVQRFSSLLRRVLGRIGPCPQVQKSKLLANATICSCGSMLLRPEGFVCNLVSNVASTVGAHAAQLSNGILLRARRSLRLVIGFCAPEPSIPMHRAKAGFIRRARSRTPTGDDGNGQDHRRCTSLSAYRPACLTSSACEGAISEISFHLCSVSRTRAT